MINQREIKMYFIYGRNFNDIMLDLLCHELDNIN